MKIRKAIRQRLSAPLYRAKVISGWQNTNDIIRAIQMQHIASRSEAAKISDLFCADNERDTARNIYNFLRSEMQYRIEPAASQTTKTISRYIADGYGDCKHLAIFANTVLEHCGYKPVYRFAGYRNNRDLQHVYTYLPKSNTVLDAVLPSFDTEKTPKAKKDISMSLYQLSGVENEVGAVSFSKIKSNLQKASAKASTTVQKVVKTIPAAAAKLADTTKTISLAAPRTAFLGLVAMNIRGLASSLQSLIAKKGIADGLQFWEQFGGDRAALQKAIASGSQKKRIFGIAEENAAFNEIYGGYSGEVYIGEVVTAATAIATATPIIAKVADVLKKAGINPDDVKRVVETAKSGSAKFKEITGKNVTDVIFKKDAGKTSAKASINADDLKDTDQATAEKVVSAAVAQSTGTDIQTINEIANMQSANPEPQPNTNLKPLITDPAKPLIPKNLFTNRNLLIAGGAAVALYLLLKRR